MCLWWRAVGLMTAILSFELIVIVIIRIVLNLMVHHRHGFLDSVRDRCLPLVSGFAIEYRLVGHGLPLRRQCTLFAHGPFRDDTASVLLIISLRCGRPHLDRHLIICFLAVGAPPVILSGWSTPQV